MLGLQHTRAGRALSFGWQRTYREGNSDFKPPPMGHLVCNEVLARRPRRRLYSIKKGKVSRNENGRRKWEKLDYEVAIECRIRAENDGMKGGLGKKVHMYWMEKN